MSYYASISQEELVSIILSTKKDLYLAMPALHPEVVAALEKLAGKSEAHVYIVMDFDAQTFRQGYGDFNSVERLVGHRISLKTLKDNRISFLISDEIGYYLFLESRNMVPANKSTLNAIRIDPVSIVRLKQYFFADESRMNFEDELTNAIIEESQNLKNTNDLIETNGAPVAEITSSDIQKVKSDIEKNPPLNPDYKRIVETYSNKFQYVKLKFEGANLQHRRIRIPPKALPIADATLKARLDTKLNLFDKSEVFEKFKPLNAFKEKLDIIREKYLKKVKSRDESLLEKVRKEEFRSEVKDLEKELEEMLKQLLTQVAKLINDTEQGLLKELVEFFLANSNVLFKDQQQASLFQDNKEYTKKLAEGEADKVIKRISWPVAHELLSKMKIEVQFSDITFEDLKNSSFVDELKDCGLIEEADVNKLADFSRAVAINE